MELSEVFAELEKGSTKTYEAYSDDGARVTMSRNGKYPYFKKLSYEGIPYEQQSRNGDFSGNCKFGLDWSPVRISVGWDLAIREWAFGKAIYCEIGGCRFASDSKEFSITPRMIQFGVWYVED